MRFPGANTTRPVKLPHRWEDSAELCRFSGTATYTTPVHLHRTPHEACLALGSAVPADAGDSQRSGLRGRSFRAHVVPPVGEIAEVIVNGARAMEAGARRYGRRFRIQDLDLATTDVNSGLLAVPHLRITSP